MKRLISVLLSALILSSCFALTAYADENPENTVKESFKAYLEENYGKGEDFKYRNFGTVDGYSVIYGYNHIDPIEGSTAVIGDYSLSTPATQGESAGLYLYKDNTFYPFNDKSEFLKDNNELIRKIADLLMDSFGEGLAVSQVICRYPTEPIYETEPETTQPDTEPLTEPDDNIYPKPVHFEEIDYLSMMKNAGYDVDFAKYVGTVGEPNDTVCVLVYASKEEIAEVANEITIGDYLFTSSLHYPDRLGLFLIYFNYYRGWSSEILSLEKSASYYVNMNEVYKTIKNAENIPFNFVVRHRDGDEGIKCYDAIKKSFGAHDYSKNLGQVDGCNVVYAGNIMVSPAEYWETLGKYTFVNYNYVARYPLGLYIVKDDTAYSLKDAYEKSVIKNESLGDVALLAGEYVDVIISESGENAYEAGSECIDAIWRAFGKHDYYDILGEINGGYLVYARYTNVSEANYIENVGNYTFENPNRVGRYELGLYFVKDRNAYSLIDAYNKGLISESGAAKAVELVKNGKIGISVTENKQAVDEVKPLNKKSNPMTVTVKTASVKASALKKFKRTVKPLTIKSAVGKITAVKIKQGTSAKIYSKIKVNPKSGAVTLAKAKYKKGTYKIKLKITAAGSKAYKAKIVSKTVKIKIK